MGIIRSEPRSTANDVSEADIDRLSRELVEMDIDVVAYLKDPAGQATPNFERLVSRIQSLPERPDFQKTLTLKISNLKYKTLYFERAWRQIRENVTEVEAAQARGETIPQQRRKETYFCAPTQERKDRLEAKGVKVADMLYDMQTMKLDEHGVVAAGSGMESKPAFRARIARQYQQIKDSGQRDKKVVLVWNAEDHCCDLIVDRRSD